MGITVCFWHCAIFVQYPTLTLLTEFKKRAFSFKTHPKENLKTYKIKSLCILLWKQTDRWILLFWGTEDKKQGWAGSHTAYMIFCLKSTDNKKLELSPKYSICVFSLWKPAFSGSHITSPQGREPIQSRLNQMGKSHVPAAADGSSAARSHRDPLSQTSLPCQKLCFFFLRPDQMVCEALG